MTASAFTKLSNVIGISEMTSHDRTIEKIQKEELVRQQNHEISTSNLGIISDQRKVSAASFFQILKEFFSIKSDIILQADN